MNTQTHAASSPGDLAPAAPIRIPVVPAPSRPDSEQPETDGPAPLRMHDRRVHRRFRVERPGKVFRRSTQQYVPVRSRDVSFSGALLEIATDRPFAVGEVLDLGLAMTKSAVVPSKALIRAVVLRSEAVSQGVQCIAVRYLGQSAMSQAA